MTICEEVGGWAAKLAETDIPGSVLQRADLQRRSIRAAAQAGVTAAAPFAAVSPQGPLGEIFRTAAASMAHDWDDYLYMGHTGHSTVPVSQAFSGNPGQARVAQVAANEVAGRLGTALLVGPHNGQFWAPIHCAGAAVAAGVGLGLDRDRLAHALAIALYQPPFGLWPGFMGPSTKLLTAAEPAVQGARAAQLAAQGVDGALDVIEAERGLLANFAFARRTAAFGGLGDIWLTDTLAFKPRPGCAYLQAAVDAVLRAGAAVGEVRSIDVAGGYLTLAMESLSTGAGVGPVGVTFSAARSIAVALLAGRLTHEELDPAWLGEHEAAIADLARRVIVRHDWTLTLATVEGASAGRASLRDIPFGRWPRVLRRLREQRADEALSPATELRALVRDPALVRRLISSAVGQPSDGGTAALDTAALRMTFPCHVALRLRSGRTIEVNGEEPGACGRPLSEQADVVAQKCAIVGLPVDGRAETGHIGRPDAAR